MLWNDNLRQQRQLRNWRQRDVADQLGISVVTAQRWEQGYQQPGPYYRAKLGKLFGLSAQELGFEEAFTSRNSTSEVAKSDPVPSEALAIWTVPYARNLHFTGRDYLLNYLEQQFFPGGADVQSMTFSQSTVNRSQAIRGPGGIGKTQIAVEYAYRAYEQRRYTHTIWINASSEEAALTSLNLFAEYLPGFCRHDEIDQYKSISTAIRWLEQCEQSWLLIIDDVNDLSFIPPYLPQRGNGKILFTTQLNAIGAFASSIEVDIMSVMEGIQLLLRRAQRLAYASDEEINEAGNLVVTLAQFPLALDQAGAYMEETGCSVSDYLQFYRQHHHTLLARRGTQATRYPTPVTTAWSRSFQQIKQANPAAAELLYLFALLAPAHIPEELLTAGVAYWPVQLQQAVTDRFTFNQLLEPLLTFSLVKRVPESNLLSIHPLVRVVQMQDMDLQKQREWAERLVRAVYVIFPHTLSSRSLCLRYLEQVQVCDMLIQEHQLLLPEAAYLLEWTGTYFSECSLFALAEPLYLRSLSIWEQLVGPEHFNMIESLNGLASLYTQQGKDAQAEQFYQRALSICRGQLENEHSDTNAFKLLIT